MASPKRKRTRQVATKRAAMDDTRAALLELRRQERLLVQVSRQVKRVERLRERAKSDLLDFGIRLANQAGWHVSKSEPSASHDRTM